MEDAHTAVLQLTEGTGDKQISIFAVYDGHGGGSDWCQLAAFSLTGL